MTRQQRYPDTPWFHFHNENPHNRFTTDCVIRAIATATGIHYNTVLMEMAEQQCKTGFDMSENKAIEKYLMSKGWAKQKQPRKEDGKKYTGIEFCAYLADPKRKYIANIGGHHIVAIVGCKVWDTWDSTEGCIGNYWVKEG